MAKIETAGTCRFCGKVAYVIDTHAEGPFPLKRGTKSHALAHEEPMCEASKHATKNRIPWIKPAAS